MKTIYHPTFGTPREVPESAVDAWRKAGWLLSKPRNKAAKAVEQATVEGDA